MKNLKWLSVLLFLGLFVSCKARLDSSLRSDLVRDKGWVQKVMRTLHFGYEPSDQDIETFSKMNPEQLVDQLMEDPRFALTAYDFFTYFLGTKRDSSIDKINNSGRLSPNALFAAKAIQNKGDVFVLFDYDQPFFYHPQLMEYFSPLDSEGNRSDGIKGFEILVAENVKFLQQTIEAISASSGEEAFLCAKIKELGDFQSSSRSIPRIGELISIYLLMNTQPCLYYNPDLPAKVSRDFKKSFQNKMDTLALLEALKGTMEQLADKMMDSFDRWQQSPKDAGAFFESFVTVATDRHFVLGTKALNIEGFYQFFTNSSTNQNRKRAAEIMRTYLCDDMTELNLAFEDMPTHTGNAHLTSPGCRSCHYKLDPLAGFFRYKGIAGLDFSVADFILFDDNTVFAGSGLDNYLGQWQPPTGDIGHYTSPTTKAAIKGNSLSDLFGYFRESPASKRCLAKRAGEYFIGKGRMINSEWIESLAADLKPSPQSSADFKKMVKQLVLSESFYVRNPDPNKCYGKVPPEKSDSKIPCEVSFIIKEHCLSCHRDEQVSAGLNMEQWVKNGDSEGFLHIDQRTGAVLSVSESFERILASLSTKDATKLMPQGMTMPDYRRQALHSWSQRQMLPSRGDE